MQVVEERCDVEDYYDAEDEDVFSWNVDMMRKVKEKAQLREA